MNREQYPQQNTARMEKILKTSARKGLTTEEAAERLRKNGKNKLGNEREHPLLGFLKSVLRNGSLPIALLGFGASVPFLGMRTLPFALLYLAFLVLYCAFFLVKEKGLRAHRARLLPRVRVIRDGKEQSISPEFLVVGDLLLLSPGDILYAHAHVTTESDMTVYGRRDGAGAHFVKHGGDCFDRDVEPFNTLLPGDIIREGSGAAFITGKSEGVALPDTVPETFKNYGGVCKVAMRISVLVAVVLLLVATLRAVLSENYLLLGESFLLATLILSTAGSAFYPMLFELLFLHRNNKNADKNGVLFASVADAETLSEIDSFVLSTRSMFGSASYACKYFETASGKRVKEKMRGTSELSMVADTLLALRKKCELSMEEEAVLAFSEKHASGRGFALYARSVSEKYTLASYRTPEDGRSFSLVFGDAEALIPGLLYFSEDGKTRILDTKQRDVLLEGVRHFKKSGYRFLLFAETGTRNARDGMPQSFSDMKLLGFFALRKVTDSQAARTLELLKNEKKKVFFIHDGENADWLTGEIPLFDGIPILDGSRQSFREELAYFVRDEEISFCMGVHLTALQRTQVASALESSGRKVLAFGDSFEDHRMMCAATAAITSLNRDVSYVPPLVVEAASAHVDSHVTSQVESVRRAPHLLGGYGVFAAALCASLLGRSVIALLGVIFGKIFLGAEYFAVLGVAFDLLALYCFMRVGGKGQYEGTASLVRENRKNFSFFAGFLVGALAVGAFASYFAYHPQSFAFAPGGFVFVALLLMLNVGMWRFSTVRETTAMLLYPISSILMVVLLFLVGYFTEGRFGFLFHAELFFWALFPIAVLMAVGKLFEAYFEQKNNFHIGEDHERM